MEQWVEVDVPATQMWAIFSDVRAWHDWNPCIWRAGVGGGELKLGARLRWVFNPIRKPYLYKLPATATVVAFEPGRMVTWEVRIGGAFHALHSYVVEPIDADRCWFGSWEIGQGPLYRLLRRFWLAHFRFVARESCAGAQAVGDRLKPKVRARHQGTPAAGRPPIVAIPGIDGSAGSLAPILDRLARTREVILVDYTTEQNPSLEALAGEVAAVAARATEGPVDLLGQSIGTLVAALVAGSGKVEVRKVVLIATFTRARWMTLRMSNALSRLTPRFLYRLTVVPLIAGACGPVGDGWRHPFLAATLRADQAAVRRRTAWQISRDFTEELAAIPGPVRVIMGGKDRFVPDAAREIEKLRAIFGREAVVVVPRAGHVMLPSAAVETAAAEIEAFTP